MDGFDGVILPVWITSTSGNDPYVFLHGWPDLVGVDGVNPLTLNDELLFVSVPACDLFRFAFFLLDILPKDMVGATNFGTSTSAVVVVRTPVLLSVDDDVLFDCVGFIPIFDGCIVDGCRDDDGGDIGGFSVTILRVLDGVRFGALNWYTGVGITSTSAIGIDPDGGTLSW